MIMEVIIGILGLLIGVISTSLIYFLRKSEKAKNIINEAVKVHCFRDPNGRRHV